MPEAIAMTFFTAPPTSTPITSLLAYTRKRAWCNACAVTRANSSSPEASVSAVGRPCATSWAKLGPDNTAHFHPCGNTSATT